MKKNSRIKNQKRKKKWREKNQMNKNIWTKKENRLKINEIKSCGQEKISEKI